VTGSDGAGSVRPGEELDAARLTAWLKHRLPAASAEIEISQFPHGHSNLTYFVRAGEAEYVLRRPPVGNVVKSAHDMGREFRMLEALAPVFAEAPRPLLFCDDAHVLGTPFYLMERRTGIVFRRELPAGLNLTPTLADRVSASLVDTLVRLHGVDYQAAGLGSVGRPEGYVARQVRGWSERYTAAATEQIPEMDSVAGWMAERVPAESGAAVIHNDFKFDNLLLDPDDPARVVAVLDWEMATVGCPLTDLGTALAMWIEARDRRSCSPRQWDRPTTPGCGPASDWRRRMPSAPAVRWTASHSITLSDSSKSRSSCSRSMRATGAVSPVIRDLPDSTAWSWCWRARPPAQPNSVP